MYHRQNAETYCERCKNFRKYKINRSPVLRKPGMRKIFLDDLQKNDLGNKSICVICVEILSLATKSKEKLGEELSNKEIYVRRK